MTTIKAPFNFVPFDSEQVFYPNWANKISQDIPFEDGVSGTLTLKIEACSPIYVRNGHLDTEKKDTEFSKFKELYFIPSTSVKGMLRTVLEILSFSKLSIYNDDRYAVRDLNNRALYMSKMIPEDRNGKKFIRCGWLTKEEKNGEINYKLQDCGEPAKISFSNIDKIFGTTMNRFFQKNGHYSPSNSEHKSAKFKYHKFSDVKAAKEIHCLKKEGKDFIKVKEGKEKGVIVFTGQPSHRSQGRQKGRGKGNEFVFWEKEISNVFTVPKEVIDDFKFAYFDHDEDRQSTDWKYWTKKINNKERVPVFFQLNENKDNVAHLGLSYLYKLPYKHRIGDYLEKQDLTKMDLAECIFGRVETAEKKGVTLKGRVHIGHAFAQANTAKKLDVKKEIMSSPKASFYPMYVHQKILNGQVVRDEYRTFMDEAPDILAGRKRYPVHKNGVQSNPVSGIRDKANEKIITSFCPLDKGVKFACKIAYHNLRKVELGALLSAITFHNTAGCFHSIGMAKPLGYGKIKIGIEGINKDEQIAYMQAFEKVMNTSVKSWASHETLCELVTMTSEQDNEGNSALNYMELKGFRESKNNKEALDRYSQLDNIVKKRVKSLLDKSNAITQGNVAIDTLLEGLQQLENKCDEQMKIYERERELQEKEVRRVAERIERNEQKQNALKERGLQLDATGDLKKLGKSIDAYLRTLKIKQFEATDHTVLLHLLSESYALVDPLRSKTKHKAWQEKLLGKLKKWLNDEVLAEEWGEIILEKQEH